MADSDRNGWLSVQELESYVYDRVRELTDNAQTPQIGSLSESRFSVDMFAIGG